MEISKKTEEELNLLINLHEDRIRIYEHAQTEAGEDKILLGILRGNIALSELQIKDLSQHIADTGGTPEAGSTIGGELYRAWTELLEAFAGQPIAVALRSCEKSDEKLANAYTELLNNINEPPLLLVTQQLLRDQQLAITERLNELTDWLTTYSVPDLK